MEKSSNTKGYLKQEEHLSIKESETLLKKKKLLSMISMSKGANRLAYGFDAVKKTIKDGSCKLLILTKDLSQNTKEEITFLSNRENIENITLPFEMVDMLKEIGKEVGILSIMDKGLSVAIVKKLNSFNKSNFV